MFNLPKVILEEIGWRKPKTDCSDHAAEHNHQPQDATDRATGKISECITESPNQCNWTNSDLVGDAVKLCNSFMSEKATHLEHNNESDYDICTAVNEAAQKSSQTLATKFLASSVIFIVTFFISFCLFFSTTCITLFVLTLISLFGLTCVLSLMVAIFAVFVALCTGPSLQHINAILTWTNPCVYVTFMQSFVRDPQILRRLVLYCQYIRNTLWNTRIPARKTQ
ncbi:hypothetical protein CRM22_001501 [Opisthorchis felineus]|uniref:Uncharacterized protein n=1 Tax=Opisthorchis felineus TaxID=147828 RepID=A0A4S2MAJ8_OPIFE|nr:hypothetical protein CRM22_001501 [Opisthorchis felineus]